MGKAKKIAIGIGAALVAAAVAVVLVMANVPGCSTSINELRGDLVGNAFVITTYDNYGQQTMKTSGRRVNVSGNKVKTSGYTETGVAFESWELSSVITITIDGREMETCGDTCIFAEKGLKPDLDFTTPEFIEKSQMGQPIAAYSGNNVYWEVKTDLPKTTKLMIDNKALYIHRANFQIIDTKLLDK